MKLKYIRTVARGVHGLVADVVAQRLPAVFSQPRSVTFNESRMKQSLDKRKTHFCIGPMLKNDA